MTWQLDKPLLSHCNRQQQTKKKFKFNDHCNYQITYEFLENFVLCVHVLLAPPSVLGAWSMALVLWLPFNFLL